LSGVERQRQELSWNEAPRFDVLADEFGDIVHGRTGIEDRMNTGFLHEVKILLGNDAADQKENVFHLVLPEQFRNPRDNGVMRARKNREADHVHVFLQGRADNHFRRLPKAGIDDLHAGITQGPGDYFGATIMAVKAWFGNQDTDFAVSGHVARFYQNRTRPPQ